MATAISERYIGNGNGQHGIPLALHRADEVDTLRRERDAAMARAQAAEARAQTAERQVSDVWRIINRAQWRHAERNIYAAVILRGNKETEGNGPAVLDGASDAWANIAGRGTVNATLKALKDAKLLNRPTTRTPVKGRDGETRWQTDSVIFAPLQAPETLPETLAPGANRTRSKALAKSARNAQRRAERIIAGLECPHCHKVGTLGIVCKGCGCVVEPVKGSAEPAECQTLAHSVYIGQTLTSGEDVNDAGAGGDVAATLAGDGWPKPTTPPVIEPPIGQTLTSEAGGAADALVHLAGDALAGAEAVEYLARAGAAFTFAAAGGKKAVEAGWPDKPHGLRDALAHLKRGGNVGILSGAGGLAVIDLDEHAGEFLRAHPHLAAAPLVFRRDAPERVKIVIRLEGEAGEHFAAGDDARRKVEYLASRHHGIIAGTHASGAVLEVRPGEMPTMTGEAARAICVAWADVRPPIIEPPVRTPAKTPATASSTTGSGRASAAEMRALWAEAIAWANADADIRGIVDGWLAKLPRDGKYYSIRPDDRTPSAKWGDCDGQRRIMRDFGRVSKRDAAMDDFELWTRITHNGDKGAATRAAIRLYCTATGKPIPAWLEVRR